MLIPIWWRGWGNFTPATALFGVLLGVLASSSLHRPNALGIAVGLVVGALVNWLLARKRPGSSLYFIPMPAWSVAMLGLAGWVWHHGL